jgi:hypothetical protein
MANLNTPFGFLQYRGTGSSPTFEQVVARIAPTNTTPIYSGDAVSYVTPANGYIQQAVAGTAPVAGIFVGCKYLSVSQKKVTWSSYWPGSDAAGDVEAYIVNDPLAQWEVQAGAVAIDASKIGQNVQLNPGVGNPNTGRSGMYVENPAATATLPFRIVGVVTFPPGSAGTDTTTPYNRVVVAFNNAVTRNNGATPGIA